MLSLLKRKKKDKDAPKPEPNQNDSQSTSSQSEEKQDKTEKKPDKGEIDYSKLLDDDSKEKPEKQAPKQSEPAPDPLSDTNSNMNIPRTESHVSSQNINSTNILELKETLSGIYALLEKQNKILENLTGMQTINKHDTELDEIDNNIIKMIENGEIDARKLQRRVLEHRICSISTLFLHLKKLVKLGIVKKARKKQFMLYSIQKGHPKSNID